MIMFIGSNCVFIERGIIPPYYKCLGCKMEEATRCLNDFRFNKSGNVPRDCEMSFLRMKTETQCCPRLFTNDLGFADLSYITAGYPMALQCMEAVGCGNELIYSQLLDECKALCPDTDTRPHYTGQSLCVAIFNNAPKSFIPSLSTLFNNQLQYNTYDIIISLCKNYYFFIFCILCAIIFA